MSGKCADFTGKEIGEGKPLGACADFTGKGRKGALGKQYGLGEGIGQVI